MTTLGRMPKPGAGQYRDKRKLLFVPTLLLPAELPDDGRLLVDRFWSEVRDNVASLERSLGKISRVFHEALHAGGEDGLQHLESLNPWGQPFIKALAFANATLEVTEDVELLRQASDWQRCLSVGLASEKVRETAMNGIQESSQKRYEFIASRVDEALKPTESGILFLREDHRVQFPADIQVFYVSPPAAHAVNQWLEDTMREMAQQAARQAEQPPDDAPPP